MKPPEKVPRGMPHSRNFARPILGTLRVKTGTFHRKSLSLHAGNWTVSKQLLVHATKARSIITESPNVVSTMRAAGCEVRENDPFGTQIQIIHSARGQPPLY